MTTPRLIRQIAVAAGLAWWIPALLAMPTDELEELSDCLKRLPVYVTPNQVGAEGKISMTDVVLFDLEDGIADDLTYSTKILFFNGKWMYSALCITQQRGEHFEANGTDLFETVALYFKHHLGPTSRYTITSEVREDGESGSTNRCVFWRNDVTGFEIDLDYQGGSVVTLNLCVMALDYYSDNGFLGERIRGFYNEKVFPASGVLPAGFPAKWERDAGRASTNTERVTHRIQTELPETVIRGNDTKSSGSGASKPSMNGVKVWMFFGALIVFLIGVAIHKCWKRNRNAN